MTENENKPDEKIDDAKVLLWAWSGSSPFGFVGDVEIYGLAICQYEDATDFYRFSCDENWETQQDGLYDSIEQAKDQLPDQYRNVQAKWNVLK